MTTQFLENLLSETDLRFADFFSEKTPPKIQHNSNILIVEDDESYRLIWDRIFESVRKNVKIEWVSTEEAAERMIRNRFLSGKKYDLIIADVFLAGKKTGIDLWQRYGVHGSEFLLVSGQDAKRISSLFDDEIMPPFLPKPLDIHDCSQVLNGLLTR